MLAAAARLRPGESGTTFPSPESNADSTGKPILQGRDAEGDERLIHDIRKPREHGGFKMLEFEQSPEAHTWRIKRRVIALALLMVLDAYGMLAGPHQDLKPVQASNRSAAIHFGSVSGERRHGAAGSLDHGRPISLPAKVRSS